MSVLVLGEKGQGALKKAWRFHCHTPCKKVYEVLRRVANIKKVINNLNGYVATFFCCNVQMAVVFFSKRQYLY